jgi:radical SAM protein with 4Fe4S-binding SPASM domain
MYYSFNRDIYLVKGAVHSCIYDIAHNTLYKINKEVYDFLTQDLIVETIKDEAEKKLLNTLVEKGILSITEDRRRKIAVEDIYNYERKISFVWIELTNRCNMRCIHCYNEKDETPKQDLDFESFKHIVDEIVGIGVKDVQLIGGEPFLINSNVIFQMMDYISPSVDTFEVFLNGTANTKEHLEEMKKRYPNLHIATSLHSFIEKEHEKITTVKGSYNKTLSTIRHIKQLDIPYRYVGALIGNIEIGNEMDFGKPSRRDYIRLSGKAKLSLYNNDLLKKRLITEKNMQFKDLSERIKSVYEESCFATHIYIGSNMDVYPCPMERRIKHGNLKNKKLNNILSSEIINQSKKDVRGCKECEYRYNCQDCRPDSLTGNFDAQPWYCTYDVYNGKWIDIDEFIDNLKTKHCNDNI